MSKVGRPKKIIDYQAVERLGNIMCTQEEIASFLDISVRTLQRDQEFCRIYNKAREQGKMSIRRQQYKLMNSGNTTMAIWLGKQYLGQRDKFEENVHQDVTIQIVEDIPKRSDDK